MNTYIDEIALYGKQIEETIFEKDKQSVIKKALLVCVKFVNDYMKHMSDNMDLQNEVEKRTIGIKAFLNADFVKNNNLATLLIINYIKQNNFYNEQLEEEWEDCKNSVLSNCYTEIQKAKAKENTSLVDLSILFFELLLCEKENELESEIKQYVNTCFYQRKLTQVIEYIKQWTITGIYDNFLQCGNVMLSIEDFKILCEDKNINVAAFYYLVSIKDDEDHIVLTEGQLKTTFSAFISEDIDSLSDISKTRLVNCIDILLIDGRLKEVQNFISERKYLYRMLGNGEITKYLLTKPREKYKNTRVERMMLYLLDTYKTSTTKSDLEQVTAWYEEMNSLSYLDQAAKNWARWYVMMEKMIVLLHSEAMDEELFLTALKKEIKQAAAYPYRETDYIKKICEKQSVIFCIFFRKKWSCRNLIEALGENNLFAFNKNHYIGTWPMALMTKEVLIKNNYYEAEIKGFLELYSEDIKEAIDIYMNSNLRYIYSIKEFLQQISISLDDIGEINRILSGYRVRARVLSNDTSIRARNKVQMLSHTLFSGYNASNMLTINRTLEDVLNDKRLKYDRKQVLLSALIAGEEQWCGNHVETINMWPAAPFDCTCVLKVFVTNKKESDDTKVEIFARNCKIEDALLLDVNKKEALHKFYVWLDAIKSKKVIYNPYQFWGTDRDAYIEAANNGEKGGRYNRARLSVMKPSQVQRVNNERYTNNVDRKKGELYAKKILDVYLALRDEPIKVMHFLKLLNAGNIDNINEFKYNRTGRNNGGILKGEMNKKHLTLLHNPEFLAHYERNPLEVLCESSLPVNLIVQIYMNTCLRQYISIVDFFTIMKEKGKELSYNEFISSEYENEYDSKYTFCLMLKDIVPEGTEQAELRFVLYPNCESEAYYKDIKWVYKDIGEINLQPGEVVRGSISSIDGNTVYLEKISPCYEDMSWEKIERNFNDLRKQNDQEHVERQVRNIEQLISEYIEYYKEDIGEDSVYFYGTRLKEVTKLLIQCFVAYRYDIKKCNIVLSVFGKNNPYLDVRAKEQLKSTIFKDENLEKTFKRFEEQYNLLGGNLLLSDVLNIYYKSFLHIYDVEKRYKEYSKNIWQIDDCDFDEEEEDFLMKNRVKQEREKQ